MGNVDQSPKQSPCQTLHLEYLEFLGTAVTKVPPPHTD
jgi:hypothetical protein